MKTVRQLLAEKKLPLSSVSPETTVLDVLKLMATQNIGSVLVLEGERLVGIFTERDYARIAATESQCLHEQAVRSVMSDKVIYVTPEHTSAECMAIMTEKRCRHLPVLDADLRVLGIVSIGDVVKEALEEQQFIIEQLVAYIAS